MDAPFRGILTACFVSQWVTGTHGRTASRAFLSGEGAFCVPPRRPFFTLHVFPAPGFFFLTRLALDSMTRCELTRQASTANFLLASPLVLVTTWRVKMLELTCRIWQRNTGFRSQIPRAALRTPRKTLRLPNRLFGAVFSFGNAVRFFRDSFLVTVPLLFFF